jgi:hypothetical protein
MFPSISRLPSEGALLNNKKKSVTELANSSGKLFFYFKCVLCGFAYLL